MPANLLSAAVIFTVVSLARLSFLSLSHFVCVCVCMHYVAFTLDDLDSTRERERAARPSTHRENNYHTRLAVVHLVSHVDEPLLKRAATRDPYDDRMTAG